MSFAQFDRRAIDLCTDRVSPLDGARQMTTAELILERLRDQPGLVLADEVGMGKTFVALAVAVSILLERRLRDPVVVMVPPSLKDKWPRDWDVFRQKCLRHESDRNRIRSNSADSGVAFLRLLDDPPERRAHVIFLTHGALHRKLTDGFVKLAVLKRAFKGRGSLAAERQNFGKFAGRLLQMESFYETRDYGLLGDLFERPCADWLRMLQRAHPDIATRHQDDPVPRHLQEVLDKLESCALEKLVDVLRSLPLRESANVKNRIQGVRDQLAVVVDELWNRALKEAKFSSPLLVLDEAHHLKNPRTRLASLFVEPEADAEAELFGRQGALSGKFERMLFLTATPFQLGHHELLRVLERFDGICWTGATKPTMTREAFQKELRDLEGVLNSAQATALRLDRAWGALDESHLRDEKGTLLNEEAWWRCVERKPRTQAERQVLEHVQSARNHLQQAERALQPWVLRHLRSPKLPGSKDIDRRKTLTGAGIREEELADRGLEMTGDALFPFLLAGRAQSMISNTRRGRALFAEGLASSFEAYRETREGVELDEDPDQVEDGTAPEAAWYLMHLDGAFPSGPRESARFHPKIAATTDRALKLWLKGEKVLIFSHYRATGRALERHISSLLQDEILRQAAGRLGHSDVGRARQELARLGHRFFDPKSPVRKAIDQELEAIVSAVTKVDPDQAAKVGKIVLRFLRTPSFLVRHFPLGQSDDTAAFHEAIQSKDVGGQSLRSKIETFTEFLFNRCTEEERKEILDALLSIQTGSMQRSFDDDEMLPASNHSDERRSRLLPNVRRATGETDPAARRRMLLAFNTPFFPEILIASSVLAEGVDLHLHCRHVIHHDLCWNPSVLEQRTGRVDRLGSYAERVGESIHVFLPYVAATQDEKMFRVVRDRERWFQILLGDKYEVDEAATDRRARRIPLPTQVQQSLMLRLDGTKPLGGLCSSSVVNTDPTGSRLP